MECMDGSLCLNPSGEQYKWIRNIEICKMNGVLEHEEYHYVMIIAKKISTLTQCLLKKSQVYKKRMAFHVYTCKLQWNPRAFILEIIWARFIHKLSIWIFDE